MDSGVRIHPVPACVTRLMKKMSTGNMLKAKHAAINVYCESLQISHGCSSPNYLLMYYYVVLVASPASGRPNFDRLPNMGQ